MALRIYNTLTGKKEEFKPLAAPKVNMYVCGPTVYDLSHIGHARSAVSFDVIYRYLKYSGYNVIFAKNYTDIDDKIIARANKDKQDPKEIAQRYINAYDEDMTNLGVVPPTYAPKATETISEMVEFIKGLMEKNHAYEIDGDVFYSVRRFNDYGKLSGKNIEELESGARVEVDDRKKDPLDFALWKKSKPGEPSWQSPWGRGRPGWHIECSAMCMKLLGPTLDIHGGGKDLIFPHHENEIAQSEALTGKTFVRYWLHNGFVNIGKEKMSKSLGNILTIREVLKRHTCEAIRVFLLSSHYRSPIDYSKDSLKEAEAKAERFYRTLERIESEYPEVKKNKPSAEEMSKRLKPILAAMDDDFNTAMAIGKIFEEVNEANRFMDKAGGKDITGELSIITALFKEAGRFLSIFEKTPEQYFKELKEKRLGDIDAEDIERLIKQRDEARSAKDYKKADKIRKELMEKGVILEDTPDGTRWVAG